MTERTKYREVTSEFRATVTEVERIGESHVRVVARVPPSWPCSTRLPSMSAVPFVATR